MTQAKLPKSIIIPDEEIVDLDKLIPQAYEPISDREPLLDAEDEEQDNDWREEIPKRETLARKDVKQYVANENTPILSRHDSDQRCCCTIC